MEPQFDYHRNICKRLQIKTTYSIDMDFKQFPNIQCSHSPNMICNLSADYQQSNIFINSLPLRSTEIDGGGSSSYPINNK